MSSNPNTSPVNPIPPVVVLLALVIFGVEAMHYIWKLGFLGGISGVDHHPEMISDYGISGFLVSRMIETGRFPLEHLQRFVTYAFIHVSFTHMIFACVLLLALGKFVGEIFRWWAVLLVFFASSIIGAVVYGLIIDSRVALVGAYPAVYGLIGAFTFLLWVDLAAHGANKMRAFTLIGFLLFIQLIFGVFFGGGADWIADIAGFVTGFLLSFVVSPGGWSRALDQLRRR
jgi:membrane associated rhomboid family serine protease